jgi:hypothetical protein
VVALPTEFGSAFYVKKMFNSGWHTEVRKLACAVYLIIQFECENIDMECSLAGGHDTQVKRLTSVREANLFSTAV